MKGQTTGKYKTRAALEKAVWIRRHSDMKTLNKIAAEVRVSVATVRKILAKELAK